MTNLAAILADFDPALVARDEFAAALAGYPESARQAPHPEGDHTNAMAWHAGVAAAQRLDLAQTPIPAPPVQESAVAA
ncbi:hypothetical protein CCR97_19015 [Rhodoplanes elegans]|uniref:Uncharacterized protein n=1 Tax=Rhodoplanes elegans TaxID=29408 RepID=A0A327KS10_9BRAD|nr:hypothetical protein [Rhodoplanes elegans]MBK5960276.1 hypothetical protein [Rhodoplanes elegans]RAI40724.1 hypothetical protein CH338_05400 [Rhodoplanes elegans]